tara:strand:- start:109 stop:369 length:261 start_codon:yes stop_codon:yes gene_type:complete
MSKFSGEEQKEKVEKEGFSVIQVSHRMAMISSLLGLMFHLLIITFVGKYLWNRVFVKLFTFARKVDSLWDILAMYVFIDLFLGKTR